MREFGWMIYWSNQHYTGQSLVLSEKRERVFVRVCVLWRMGGVAWWSEKERNSLGWGPKEEEGYELCSRAITKILPLIRLALNNTLTDMTNRCIRACHSSLFGFFFLSSFHSCDSFLLDIKWLTFSPCVPMAQSVPVHSRWNPNRCVIWLYHLFCDDAKWKMGHKPGRG